MWPNGTGSQHSSPKVKLIKQIVAIRMATRNPPATIKERSRT